MLSNALVEIVMNTHINTMVEIKNLKKNSFNHYKIVHTSKGTKVLNKINIHKETKEVITSYLKINQQ